MTDAPRPLYRRPTRPKPAACQQCRRSHRHDQQPLAIAWSHTAGLWLCFGCYLRLKP